MATLAGRASLTAAFRRSSLSLCVSFFESFCKRIAEGTQELHAEACSGSLDQSAIALFWIYREACCKADGLIVLTPVLASSSMLLGVQVLYKGIWPKQQDPFAEATG